MAQPTTRNHAHRDNHKQYAPLTYQNQKHMVHAAVLTQSMTLFITAVRPVSNVVPKIKGNPQHALNDKGVIDSGCSWHMTRNMSYLSDVEELNGEYVAFGGNPKGGTISRKGKIRTGKFDRKVDEGFLVGYSVNSKAFRVFNIRTRIVQETLYVNFRENKPNIAGSGPTWLFDIDSLTRTMNYQPVTAGNQFNPSVGFQDKFDAEKAGEEINQQYVLFPVWSSGFINPHNSNGDATFDGKEPDFDVKKPESKVNVSPSTIAQSRKQNGKTKKEAKGKKLEDITYSNDEDNVGVEADFNNLETSITHMPPSWAIWCIKWMSRVHFYPDKVYKVVKALYGLHQAPRAWYETLVNHLIENGFQRGKIDQTLFIKRLKEGKLASTPTNTDKPLLKDPNGEDVDVHTYRCILISWQCKKQTVVATSSTDVEYVDADSYYAQLLWIQNQLLDYRPNGEALRKCILSGPYKPTTVLVQAVDTTDDSPAIPKHTIVETPINMSQENKAHFEAKKEAIHLILTRIGDEIYSTIDACQTTQEMWEAIKRLQQGESLNIQDVKTNLFWEFGKFTSYDGETTKSYYPRFYKLMNEMIRNNLTIATMQVNVQFLQQLQPEWSRLAPLSACGRKDLQ
nr:ribonuclease H-like domain-containing protein [Tanacetum cinerariifolium]